MGLPGRSIAVTFFPGSFGPRPRLNPQFTAL
jgi:hypothetical protein